MTIQEAKESHTRFRNAVSRITHKPYSESLTQFKLLEIEEREDDLTNCVCGKSIKYVFSVQHKGTTDYYQFGRCCAMQFYDSFMEEHQADPSMMEEIEHFKAWKDEAEKQYSLIMYANKKCTHCSTPWTHKHCFHKGMCKPCKAEYKGLLNTKIVLHKYKGETMKTMKEDTKYMEFCIENKTRQSDLFQQFRDF